MGSTMRISSSGPASAQAAAMRASWMILKALNVGRWSDEAQSMPPCSEPRTCFTKLAGEFCLPRVTSLLGSHISAGFRESSSALSRTFTCLSTSIYFVHTSRPSINLLATYRLTWSSKSGTCLGRGVRGALTRLPPKPFKHNHHPPPPRPDSNVRARASASAKERAGWRNGILAVYRLDFPLHLPPAHTLRT